MNIRAKKRSRLAKAALAGWLTAAALVLVGWSEPVLAEAQEPAENAVVERIQYRLRGGATPRNHYCSRTFENSIWHSHAVYEALHTRPDVRRYARAWKVPTAPTAPRR